jgi:hypothetical protein
VTDETVLRERPTEEEVPRRRPSRLNEEWFWEGLPALSRKYTKGEGNEERKRDYRIVLAGPQ